MKLKTILAIAGFAVLAACGGGGGNDDNVVTPPPVVTPPVTEAIPATASASSMGFIAYIRALFAANTDGLEPVALGDFVAPTSETSEPEAI